MVQSDRQKQQMVVTIVQLEIQIKTWDLQIQEAHAIFSKIEQECTVVAVPSIITVVSVEVL